MLISLVKESYIGGINPDGSFLVFEKPPYSTAYDTKYGITAKGEEFVENRQWDRWKWCLPLLISAISLLFSFYNIFIK